VRVTEVLLDIEVECETCEGIGTVDDFKFMRDIPSRSGSLAECTCNDINTCNVSTAPEFFWERMWLMRC
jgi:hypothetical protein